MPITQDYFDVSIAYDPATQLLQPNAVATVYDISDTGNTTPLAITDISGNPLTNLISDGNGVFPQFIVVAGNSQVRAVSGSYATVITSVLGNEGPTGPTGPGVPVGGTSGQVLAKSSGTDYDTEWVDQAGGGADPVTSVNGKVGEVVLSASDVGAASAAQGALAMSAVQPDELSGYVPSATKVNGKPLTTDISLAATDVGAVPSTRTVNGKPLSGDIVLSASDVGAASAQVPVDAWTASGTLVLTNAGHAVEVTTASAATVTVPPNSSAAFPVGTVIEIAQMGAGQLTITPGAGVTIRSAGALTKTRVQYSTVSLRKNATDTWLLVGDLG
jgi:hypothetical protein